MKKKECDCARCDNCESHGNKTAWCLFYGYQNREEVRRCGCDDFSDDSDDE